MSGYYETLLDRMYSQYDSPDYPMLDPTDYFDLEIFFCGPVNPDFPPTIRIINFDDAQEEDEPEVA